MFQLFGNAIGQVLAISVVVGGGLPALFAVGIRAMAAGAGGGAEVDHASARPAMKLVGYACFALVLAVIALGLTIIVASGFGYHVSFAHVFPTLVEK